MCKKIPLKERSLCSGVSVSTIFLSPNHTDLHEKQETLCCATTKSYELGAGVEAY